MPEALQGFWCCNRPDCSYREFPMERKQTPQVALEISSPTTFMVSIVFPVGMLDVLRAMKARVH